MDSLVIVGAGFGGVRAALVLGNAIRKKRLQTRYKVVLVDRTSFHTYTPLLYEIATTSKDSADHTALRDVAAFSLPHLFSGLPVEYVQDEAESMNVVERTVHLKSRGTISYASLIIATGSQSNTFGIPGVEEYALPFKTFGDALTIRDAIWRTAYSKKNITVVIGGGGPTGVELAGELAAWSGELAEEFPGCGLSVTLLEGCPTILNGFSKTIIGKAKRRLADLHVRVREQAHITAIRDGSVLLESTEHIPYDIVVWAGGIKPSAFVMNAPLDKEDHGRIRVDRTLRAAPHIYALGDSVCIHDSNGKPMPGVARAAIMQADVVAHNVVSDNEGSGNKRSYTPRVYPYILPIGGKYAIAKLGPAVISGTLGWILKGLVELNYLTSIMRVRTAFSIWKKGMNIFMQNDRLG